MQINSTCHNKAHCKATQIPVELYVSERCVWWPRTYRVPQRQLPLAHATEACGQDLPIGEEQSSHRPGSFVDFLSHLRAEQSTVNLRQTVLHMDPILTRGINVYVWMRNKWSLENDLEHSAPPWIYDTQCFILADGTDSTAILVPADTVDKVWVCFAQLVHQLPCAHVPHANQVITSWREKSATSSVTALENDMWS